MQTELVTYQYILLIHYDSMILLSDLHGQNLNSVQLCKVQALDIITSLGNNSSRHTSMQQDIFLYLQGFKHRLNDFYYCMIVSYVMKNYNESNICLQLVKSYNLYNLPGHE
jgi:hypothetical protein